MNNIIIALSIGIIAGIIDVIPMIFRKQDAFSCVSAFVHWLVLGLIIPFVDWNLSPGTTGAIIGLLTALPVMAIVYPKDPKALIPIFSFSLILGTGIGVAGARFIQ